MKNNIKTKEELTRDLENLQDTLKMFKEDIDLSDVNEYIGKEFEQFLKDIELKIAVLDLDICGIEEGETEDDELQMKTAFYWSQKGLK